ncbi:glycoside hydrolase family 32 protein [Paenibacillus sp. JZ16]|uniref:glycoside hydrolase family 32 protein n=1 Tax=Paenibacillus sp. JZ16 TaxID=1906272 RepID=UPI00188D5A80|nr:glycoside hydrolase family 32 protein [Paenibacillus sp. JZ16]
MSYKSTEFSNDFIARAETYLEQVKPVAEASLWKPKYHLSAPANWLSDPNGFSRFKGEYHMFYQHHPYGPTWGNMYWGHMKSRDLVNWQHMPIALAPDQNYDKDGCFSGSAVEKDGKLYLLYTGNVWTGSDWTRDLLQVQCAAVSEDGVTFTKLPQNPLISAAPSGDIHPNHFRDPKVWRQGQYYYFVLGSRSRSDRGQALLYRSTDLLNWEFVSVLAQGDERLGYMWECPDLFAVDDKHVLIISPEGMAPEGDLYHNKSQSGYLVGQFDEERGKFEHDDFYLLDYGFNFYAPQTTLDEQGRRVLIGWMSMWDDEKPEAADQWAGMMTIPRVLMLRGNQVLSTPHPELSQLRGTHIAHTGVTLKNEVTLTGIRGNCLELGMTIRAQEGSVFGLKFGCSEDGTEETVLTFDGREGKLILDRTRSGQGPGGIRKAPVQLKDGRLVLRIFIDQSCAEIFVGDGEQTMSARFYPSDTSDGIVLFGDGLAVLEQLGKWEMNSCWL